MDDRPPYDTLPERIRDRLHYHPETGCVRWVATHDKDGYGLCYAEGRAWRAHRYVWTRLVGPIPPHTVLDHRKDWGCCYRDCCALHHLDPVPVSVNARRVVPWNRLKTHCPRGHAYDRTQTCADGYKRRRCSHCSAMYVKRNREKKREQLALCWNGGGA